MLAKSKSFKNWKKGRLHRSVHTGKTVTVNCEEPHFVVKDFSGKPIQRYTANKRQFNKVQCS